MKIKVFPIVLLLLFIIGTFHCVDAQENMGVAPDYELIKKAIAQKDGDCYYPVLLKRFSQCDTTLSLEQLRALYYGTVFQSGYDPYASCEGLLSVREILKQDHPSQKDLNKGLATLKDLEQKYPTHLKLYVYKCIMTFIRFGEYSKELFDARTQMSMLFNAVSSTGDGTDYDNAYHIVYTTNSYDMMEIFGFYPTGQELHGHEGQMYDVFPLEENEEDIEQFYFNITPCYNHLGKMFKTDKATPKKQKPQSEVVIPLNSRFTLELIKGKKDTYKLNVIEIQSFTDTLCWDDVDGLQYSDDTVNRISGYFCYANYCENPDSPTKVILVFKSTAVDEQLQYESSLQYYGSTSFTSTSNVGAHSGTVITEMWHAEDGITSIRIGNFRE